MYYMLDKLQNNTLIFSLIVAMFAISGISKTYTFDSTTDSIKEKIAYNISSRVYQVITLCVIILEIAAPAIIVYHSYTGQYKQYAYYSALALAVFTVLATFLYHPPDFSNYKKSIPFWANISVTGALLLLAKHIKE